MHRFIMNPPKGVIIDHINGNPFDNRKSNLRFANKSQNAMNSKPRKNTASGHKGVSWHKIVKKWRARINVNQKEIYLGSFNSKKEAILAYNLAATQYFEKFAKLNEITNE